MKHLIMGTAGHVDHGKTALIKALTGIDCDTHKEEKRRGITINLGFSYLNLPNGESIGIIDVPGHKDFINTMVGGACGIDFVMLVIAADSGIMPQTIEHMNIINSLGVKKGIVALTKTDLVDDELIEMAKYEIHEFLEKTSLENAPVIGVSSVTGKGKEELIQEIEKTISEIEEKPESSQFRMYIDRIFSVRGFGSVVTGSVLGGSIETEKEVFLLPGNYPRLRVRAIERHGKPVGKVVAGDRAAINLIGLNMVDFKRGMIISDKNLPETVMVDATISLFDENSTLPLWSHVTFHTGTFESPAKMHAINKDKIQPKENVIVQIHLTKPAILLNKDKFIIRNSSGDKSLGGGFIIDVSPLHHKKRTPALIENLTRLAETLIKGDNIRELINIELRKEFRPFVLEEIADKLHLRPEELKTEIRDNPAGLSAYPSEEFYFLIDHNFNKNYKEKVIKILTDYHKEFPLFPDGFDTNELAGKLELSKTRQGKAFLALLLKKMEEDGLITKNKNTWIIKGHKPVIDPQSKEEIQWLENVILEYGVQKPVMADIEALAADQKITKHKLKMYFSFLTRGGKVTFYQNEFIHSEIISKYRPVMLSMLQNHEIGIEINEFKDRINATKRFCALLVGIYETEKIIRTRGSGIETRILITELGKKL